MWMKLDDFLLGLKRSDRWLCFQAWRRVGLLNPLPDCCHPLACPLSSAAIRKLLTTSYLIHDQIWRAIFLISLDISDVSIYALHCCNLQPWFHKNAITCAMWTQEGSLFKWTWHWCCTSRHYVYLCVDFLAIITWHVCSCRAAEIWSVLLTRIQL